MVLTDCHATIFMYKHYNNMKHWLSSGGADFDVKLTTLPLCW